MLFVSIPLSEKKLRVFAVLRSFAYPLHGSGDRAMRSELLLSLVDRKYTAGNVNPVESIPKRLNIFSLLVGLAFRSFWFCQAEWIWWTTSSELR